MVNQVYTAITKYFGHITNTGYMRQDNVNKLLLLIAVYNLLDNDFRALVSEDDYKLINNALYCLYGSTCLSRLPAASTITSTPFPAAAAISFT